MESPIKRNIYLGYLTKGDLKTKGFVLETNYVDRDYLIDYANFYARSFAPIGRFTTRLHFFDEDFNEEELKSAICNDDPAIRTKLVRSYIGYVIKKPIFDFEGNPLIGKTLLKTYKDETKGEPRKFLTYPYVVSFFGIQTYDWIITVSGSRYSSGRMRNHRVLGGITSIVNTFWNG